MNNTQKATMCPRCHSTWPSQETICETCGSSLCIAGGRFRLLRYFKKGGFGALYIARDEETGAEVVLKTLNKRAHQNPNAPIRFAREIQATRQLSQQSKHAVAFRGKGLDAKIGEFMALEYIDGMTLKELLKQGALTLSKTLLIFEQLCEVLSKAHELGIVHRDLKPDNIMLLDAQSEKPSVKLLDFGLVKSLVAQPSARLTSGMLGSPLYMSPEQALGLPIDQRADIYSTGLLLYEMLTGTPVFLETSIGGLIQAKLSQQPTPITERAPTLSLPKGLESAIFRALAKDANERYPNVASFARAIRACIPKSSQRWLRSLFERWRSENKAQGTEQNTHQRRAIERTLELDMPYC